jgi:uncharacterized damage-inducible protein DinB
MSAETDTLRRLRRLFHWDAWAHRETLASLQAVDAPLEGAVRLLAHIVGTSRLWWARLRREPSPLAVWPALDLDGIAAQLPPLERAWEETLDGFARDPSRLGEGISYVNSLGEPWTNTAADILEQVVQHGGYHRGQIAAAVRRAGFEPASTDFIHAVRRGFVPE